MSASRIISSASKPSDDVGSSIEYIYASFDEVVTKEIKLSPVLDRLHVASGYIVDDDDVAVAPNTIEITGRHRERAFFKL